MSDWHVYMIEASDGSLYTGITTDPGRRFAEHAAGRRGARYFRGRRPLCFAYLESGHDGRSASRREALIKAMSREQKQRLIASQRSR